jgi:hypothetical protein
MAVHVDEMTSEVTTEPEPSAEGGGEGPEWKQVERVRAAVARASRDAFRTAADGYDD